MFGLPGTLAHKYFKRSKKKYRATIISLFMSIVLFVSSYAFTSYLVGIVKAANETHGMDYTYYLSKYNYITDIDPEQINGIIKDTEHITDSAYSLEKFISFNIDRKYLNEEVIQRDYVSACAYDDEKMSGYMDMIFVDDDSFRRYAEECGVDPDDYMDKDSPKCIAYDYALDFNSETEKMDRIKYLNSTGTDVDVYVYDLCSDWIFRYFPLSNPYFIIYR